jgi:hypothetical protein
MGVGGTTTGAHGSGGKKEIAEEWAAGVTAAADAEAAPRPRADAASPARMKARQARRIRALSPVRTDGAAVSGPAGLVMVCSWCLTFVFD